MVNEALRLFAYFESKEHAVMLGLASDLRGLLRMMMARVEFESLESLASTRQGQDLLLERICDLLAKDVDFASIYMSEYDYPVSVYLMCLFLTARETALSFVDLYEFSYNKFGWCSSIVARMQKGTLDAVVPQR